MAHLGIHRALDGGNQMDVGDPGQLDRTRRRIKVFIICIHIIYIIHIHIYIYIYTNKIVVCASEVKDLLESLNIQNFGHYLVIPYSDYHLRVKAMADYLYVTAQWE